ncbi:GIY-YIG nuclease family protein [Acetobacter malorum]|uniref:GIY-YIG nuclease family protein n=1 Tax=Acetobacter malorum TaxID=178901 RepID=UPI00248E0475|nr:GIY-YIG nuclease family protein [Acetobacter malorum]
MNFNDGIIYILTNPVMPGLVKIGKTDQIISKRLKQLYSSGVPVPFECFYAKRVSDYHRVEKHLHGAFGDHRINGNREFFRIEPERVQLILELLDGEVIAVDEEPLPSQADQSDGENPITPDDVAAFQREQKRQPNFNFSMIGLKPGAVLEWISDPDIKCTVWDDKKVMLEGEIVSLTKAAGMVFTKLGKNFVALRGPDYWTFQGKTLTALREESVDEPC